MSIKQKVVSGMSWSAIERFATQGIQFLLTIIIARVLLPEDYGLVAMLGIFMALAQTLTDSGFSSAIIQKKDRTDVDYSTIFYFNIFISTLIYLLFFIMAPWIGEFYHQPQLVEIIRVLGLNLIINSFSIVQIARLTIELNFKRLTMVSLCSVLGGGSVGVWMAYHGFGVWTLVFQSLISSLCWVICLWLVVHWKPRWAFSWSSFRSMFSFGSKLMLSGLLHTLYVNMYSLIVGKTFNASTLGFFNRAYTLGQFPNQNFSYIIQKVLYPIQCKYQDEEEKFNSIFIQNIRFSCFLIFPIMVGFAILAHPLVELLLTDKWVPAVPLLRIVCIAQIWDPIMRINALVLNSKGRSDYQLVAEILKKIIAFIIMFATLPFGIEAVCWGLVIYVFFDIVIIIWFSRKVTGVGYIRQLKLVYPIALLAFAMGAVVVGVSFWFQSSIGKLISGLIAGTVFYGICAHLLKFPEMSVIYSFLKSKRLRRKR